MIIDYWFLVKLCVFRSVSKKVIFTISFFTRPGFPSVFENEKSKKSGIPTWRHLCTPVFLIKTAVFCTFFIFSFKICKKRVFSRFFAFFLSFLEGYDGIREKRGLFLVFWRKNMRFYEISKIQKKNAQKWPYKRDLICLLFFIFSKVKKRPQKRGEKPDYNVYHFNY